MDGKLLAWALAVKSRQRKAGLRDRPAIWFFTDADRCPDPRGAVARLPKGLCGVVLRHDFDPDRACLARDIARLCRARRLTLTVAGDWRLAKRLRAGWHIRNGKAVSRRRFSLTTSSAHGPSSLRRAQTFGCTLAFLSPLFPTGSHPGAKAIGALRWSIHAKFFKGAVVALGGIDRLTIVGVPKRADGVAGITAFAV